MVQPMERELVDLVKTPKKQSKTKQQRVHIFIWRRQIQTKEKKSVEESIDLEPFKVGKLALRWSGRFRRRCCFRQVELDVVLVPQVADVRIFGQLILLARAHPSTTSSVAGRLDGATRPHHGASDTHHQQDGQANGCGRNSASEPSRPRCLVDGAGRRIICRDAWLVVIALQSV